ncbi:hypothetical protein FB558_5040 [Pseudonocardia kunmingensis]|uniref:Uncharacterized protein n=1 Tax=Pseudonocardia kunmingensis TaxID=630975 RepID=A0A543DIX7_9PSEU|nr:hypothetical protein FB558_5040 [Pseudonocardia kunmingensis]
MTCGTRSLGTRQDHCRGPRSRRILASAATTVARQRRTVMADLAYALLLTGGFALLVLTLRGLQRL